MIEVLRDVRRNEFASELEKVREQMKIEEEHWSATYEVPYRRFSWLERNLTKKKEYAEYTAKRTAYEEMIADPFAEYPGQDELNKLRMQERELEEKIAKTDQMTLDGLGFTFESAISFLRENGLPVMLNEADKAAISAPTRPYQSLGDLMLVHKTKYIPVNSHINSAKEANAKKEPITYTLGGKKYSYEPMLQRNTVHFAVNGEVENIAEGNDWNSMQYTVLVPFEDVPKSKITQAPPMDTYTEGGVDLTSRAWILCPEGQRDMISQRNPGVNVIEYNAENAKGFARVVLQGLGYNCEEMGKWNWQNQDHDRQYRDVIRREGFSDVPHSGTREATMEEFLFNIDIFMDMVGNIKRDNLVKTPQDVMKIENELKEHDSTFWLYAWNTTGDETSLEKREMFYRRLEECGINMPNNLRTTLDSLETHDSPYIDSSSLSTILEQIPKEFVSEFEGATNGKTYDVRAVRDTLTRRFILTTIGIDYEREHKGKENDPQKSKRPENTDYDEI